MVRVQVVESSSFRSEWKVTGLASGRAHLIAIDEHGYEIDRTDLRVGTIHSYHVDNFSTGAVRGAARQGYDEVWNLAKNGVGDLRLDATDGDSMGALAYHVDIDEALMAHVTVKSDLVDGRLTFKDLPTGEYDVIFSAPDGSSFALLIVQQ